MCVGVPPQDEFSLGTWDKSKVTGQGDDLIRPSEEANGEGAIVLEVTAVLDWKCVRFLGWCS